MFFGFSLCVPHFPIRKRVQKSHKKSFQAPAKSRDNRPQMFIFSVFPEMHTTLEPSAHSNVEAETSNLVSLFWHLLSSTASHGPEQLICQSFLPLALLLTRKEEQATHMTALTENTPFTVLMAKTKSTFWGVWRRLPFFADLPPGPPVALTK